LTEGYQLMPCGMNMITNNSLIVENKDVITLFPNPTSTILNINSSFEINHIVVFNTLGQEIMNQTNINSNTTQINTGDLMNGIFIISLISGNKIVTEQFQVAK
ncbi:T9SS type A sorting domain-containing protein, partial [Aureispira]|nr:T9SS type A sorting domain-containing protein [Aureispira sp.]